MGGSHKKNPIHMIAFALMAIGGLNWLLVAFGWNLVEAIFNEGSTVSMVIYILVGLGTIYEIVMHKKQCMYCSSMMGDKGMSTGGSAPMGSNSMGGKM